MSTNSTSKPWYKKPIFVIPVGIIILWLILPDSTKYKLFYLFGGLLQLVFWGAVIFVIAWTIGHLRKDPHRNKTAERLRMQQPEIDLWNKLGSTKEEREKAIKKLFDGKKATIPFGTRWDFIGENDEGRKSKCFIQFQISRNLAAMESREREFLRIVFLLYNRGHLNENQWRHFRFALINGNGKASIDEFNYLVYTQETGIKDGPTTVKYYQDHDNATVDSAISELLGIIEKDKEFTQHIHGEGAWLDADEIEGSVYNGNGDYQLSLGHLENSETILHYAGEGSLITIAPPGSGKTQCFVFPNLLTWKGAAVVLDIKNEIYPATYKWRENNIGKIYKFNPLDPSSSNSYNPLTFVRDDPDYIWEDSRFLADMMIVPSGTQDFWENMARDVLTAAIAYVTFNNEAGERAMSKVLDIIYGLGWNTMITSLKTNVLVSSMRRMGNALDEWEKKLRDSVLITAQSSLSAWQGERIARVTNKSDWNPLDLRNGTPTIYICLRANEIDSYLSVVRVFIAQHIRMLTSELPSRGAAPVLFMLDELPRLKKMPPVDEALNIGRQYGIKLWMFAQNYGQLKEAYPDPEGLIGSCVIRTFMNLPLTDEFTTKISNMLGHKHNSLSNKDEPLVSPRDLAGDEYKESILVLATGTKPARLKKKFAYQDPELLRKMPENLLDKV